jgi:protein phosphatase
MLSVAAGGATHVGQVRAVNEDSLLAVANLFAVADGMGGHAAGDVASKLAIQRLSSLAEHLELSPEDIVAALADANQAILDSAAAHQERFGMGTTISGLAVVRVAGSDHWIVFNIGDSRVYRYAEGLLSQVTVDHSEVEELVAAGEMSHDEARQHPRRNVVTRSLGTDPAPIPDVWVFPPTPGERFLICSDGLTVELTAADIAAVLSSEVDPEQAALTLVTKAVEAGGRDNVTVVIVDVPGVREGLEVDEDTAPRIRSEEEEANVPGR